jgi:hypothetical protein
MGGTQMRFKSKEFFSSIVLVAILMVLPARRAEAQALYGSIVGTVTDTSDAAVPGAAVRIVHTETSQERDATTNDTGAYSFPTLPSGIYNVSVSKGGFQTFTRQSVALSIGNVVRVDARLQVGSMTETVTVRADTVALQTDRAEVRSEVDTRSLEEMPMPANRNYQNLFVTLPGFTPPSNMHSISANPSRALNFNVNGGTGQANTTRIEGAQTINVWLPHVAAYLPGLEAIESVSVVSSSLDADQGLAGAAAINLQMKSGTNQIHGSLFEYHGDNALKAKPFFLPVTQRKPKAIDNQLGGTIGGPIFKDKLFYFASYDGQFIRQTGSTFTTLPTDDIRAGIMTASSTLIYNPQTGNADGSGRIPFDNKTVPDMLIDPIVRKLTSDLPHPNLPGLLTSNYYGVGDFRVTRNKFDGKLSWHATDKLNVNGRIGRLGYDMENPPVYVDRGPGVGTNAGREGHGYGNVWNGTVSANYVLGPKLVMDTYFGFTRLDSAAEPPRMDEDLGLTYLGIPGTNSPDHQRVYGGWPIFSVTTYSAFGKANSPIYYFDPAYEYVANLSWIKGSHSLRFGGNIVRKNMDNFEESGAGSFSFSGGATTLKGGASPNQFNSYADFLLGYLSAGSRGIQIEGRHSRNWVYSMYARDQWQATRKLTVSGGVRWDYFPMGRRKTRGFEKYDFATDQVVLCGVGSTPSDCGVTTPKKNFSPRLGLAYRVTKTFVVRAGFGINYDAEPLAFNHNLMDNYPAIMTYSLPSSVNSNVAVGLLKNGLPPAPIPDLSTGRTSIPLTTTIKTPPDHFTMGYLASWNFTLQKRLMWGFIGQAGYVGSRQVKILQVVNVNYGLPGGGRDSQPYYQKFGRTGDVGVEMNFGRNSYDSLQATLARGFANGVQFNLAYTFSKTLALCCDQRSDNGPAISIPQYKDLNKAFAAWDRSHVFTVATVAELPFGRGKRWLGGAGPVGAAITSGWQINALFAAYTGLPFSVSASGTSLNAPGGNTQRADQIKPEVEILGGVNSYFDPLAFAPVTAARFGTAGFNSLHGPGLVNLDASLVRNFKLSERWELQFRGEALNATNTPHFSNPAANVSNLQLNTDGTVKNLGGYTVITSTVGNGREGIDERVYRLGLRVRF